MLFLYLRSLEQYITWFNARITPGEEVPHFFLLVINHEFLVGFGQLINPFRLQYAFLLGFFFFLLGVPLLAELRIQLR